MDAATVVSALNSDATCEAMGNSTPKRSPELPPPSCPRAFGNGARLFTKVARLLPLPRAMPRARLRPWSL